MEDGFSLQDATVGIFGLGLMGGSLAMSLKGHCAHIIGFDSDPATLERALAENIVDQARDSALTSHPLGSRATNAFRGAQSTLAPDAHRPGWSVPGSADERIDILILATPVPIILETLRQLPSLIRYTCIVMDIGSTKREILQAMSALPENFDPIGGHPICGKEKLGLENADANLYQNAPFVIASLSKTTQRAKSASRQIISLIGAKYIEVNAEDHDRILASTSHLPFIISSALAHSTHQDYSPLIGSGFRSTSRLAGTSSSMMLGVLKSNRENILNAIKLYQHSLCEIESALSNENFDELETLLNESRNSYLSLSGN